MIAFEVAFLMFLGVVIVVGIAALGRPLAEAYAERLRYKYRELGSEAQTVLNHKTNVLQQEIHDLKERVLALEAHSELLMQQEQKRLSDSQQ